jgi:hypothetical protein
MLKGYCKRILHYRNIYAFLGHLAEDLVELNINIYAECLSFLLVKKVMTNILELKQSIKNREIKGIEKW